MQLLTATCPYCGHEVETTLEHTTETVTCPNCKKPFEMEIPSAKVTSVREVSDTSESEHFADEPGERTLFKVHPAIFRQRPLGTLVVVLVIAACLYGLWMAWMRGDTPRDASLLGSTTLTEINWWLWLSLTGLILVVGTLGYWMIEKYATTLTVTDSRTIFQRGIISRDTSEVQHDDVRNIKIDQTFYQRLIGLGQIAISSSGQDDMEIVASGFANPGHIVQTIREHQR